MLGAPARAVEPVLFVEAPLVTQGPAPLVEVALLGIKTAPFVTISRLALVIAPIIVVMARMKNPAIVLPDAVRALLALDKSTDKDGVPFVTRKLVHLRASQINGCSVCVDMHARELKQAGEKDERIFAVAAWRDTPYFTSAERPALALAEAATRLSDRADVVPDETWDEAARHYNEPALAALVLSIALINLWNRLNVTVRQPVGAAWS